MGSSPLSVLWLSYLPSLRLGGQRNLERLVTGLDPSLIRSSVVSPAEGELAAAMRAKGVSVHVCELHDFTLRPSRYRPSAREVWRTLRETRELRAVIRREGARVVYADSPAHARFAWLAGQGLDTRVLWHAQVSNPDPIWDTTLAGCVDRIIAVSRGAARRFESMPQLTSDRLDIVYNGVDTDLFRGVAAPDARERLYPGAPADAVIAVYAGSLVQVKGIDELVVAAAKLAADHPRVHFSVVGEGSQEYREELAAYVARTGARVHFTGFLGGLESLLPGADMLVFPSYCEGLPLVVLEALASGLPVVATDVPGSQEIVDGEVGRLVPVRNVEALCAAVIELSRDPGLRRALGARARERASRYTLGRCVERFESTFVEMSRRAPRARLSAARSSSRSRPGAPEAAP